MSKERKSMLSRAELLFFRAEEASVTGAIRSDEAVIEFYEDLIAKGKLMVVRTVEVSAFEIHTRQRWHNDPAKRAEQPIDEYRVMPCCGNEVHSDRMEWNFCPSCAAKITTP